DLSATTCAFGYRDSAFKSRWKGRYVVLAMTLRLPQGKPAPAAYAELRRALEAKEGDATLAQIRDVVLEMRRRKGMVVDPNDADSRSAGSFFVNPIIQAEELAAMEQRSEQSGARQKEEALPFHPIGKDQIKLPAAWLMEHAGFKKGHVHGAVGISNKHALALINRGGGTAQEIIALAQEIREGVFEHFGIWLAPEPRFVGFASPPFPAE
ncbi:MAG: UDP-N-acetylenolpyruvoylglucosamine reductase, partial [Deltaproteobacteria bacterium]|nr:UDP-N-acetylenolpyruvoylglucosamine reductase [Deltaproteobacteria bacterium]